MSRIKLENLEINGYHLYQNKTNFNFGIDAVLLANFALRESNLIRAISTSPFTRVSCASPKSVRASYASPKTVRASYASPTKICDLCSGTLPIPLIIYAKSHMEEHCEPTPRKGELCEPSLHIDAFEIDKGQAKLSQKSVLWNKKNVLSAKNIDQDINVYNEDIKNIFLDREKYKNLYESYDIVTVNPPYNKKGSGLINLNDKIISARHEITITFDDICKAASLLLKSNKKLYLIHQTNRFTEIVSTLKKHSFEIKKAAFIHPYIHKPSNLFLIEAVKNGNSGIKILPPIVIYDKPNVYTKSILQIYGK